MLRLTTFTLPTALPDPRTLRVEVLAGLVVALALIPEAISFSIIAGVDPKVGLYASFTMAVAIAFTGGRPAMISAATGAMALVVVGLVKDHGVEYLLAATILAGLVQVSLGLLRVPRLMRFVPRSVMTASSTRWRSSSSWPRFPTCARAAGSASCLSSAAWSSCSRRRSSPPRSPPRSSRSS